QPPPISSRTSANSTSQTICSSNPITRPLKCSHPISTSRLPRPIASSSDPTCYQPRYDVITCRRNHYEQVSHPLRSYGTGLFPGGFCVAQHDGQVFLQQRDGRAAA